MSDCKAPEIRDRLLLYVEGELTPLEASAVEQHMETCLTCQGEAQALRNTLTKLSPGSCPAPEAILSFAEGKPLPDEVARHIAKCPECAQLIRAFNGLDEERATEPVAIPPWFSERVKQVYHRRLLAGSWFSWLSFSRPALAFASYLVLAIVFLSSGVLYNLLSMRAAVSNAPLLSHARSQSQVGGAPALQEEKKSMKPVNSPAERMNMEERKVILKAPPRSMAPHPSLGSSVREAAPLPAAKPAPRLASPRARSPGSAVTSGTPKPVLATSMPTRRFAPVAFILMLCSIPFWVLAGLASYRWLRAPQRERK